MAERKFSELPSAASLTGNELAALSQMQSGSLASVKSTLQAIANWFAVYAQYTTALQTTDKSIAGAINELKQLISLIPQFSIEVVQVLPTEDISDTTIYLVPAEDPEVGNYYEEYIHVNNTWELVGTTAVDLSAYYTKIEVDGLLADKLEADDFEASQTASTNPITLETKQAGLAKSCVVEMNPIQDLHGYSNPWVGGAGINKLNLADMSGSANFYYLQSGTGYALTAGQTYTLSADITSSVEPFNFSIGAGDTNYALDIAVKNNLMNGRNTITFTPTEAQLSYGSNMFLRVPRYSQVTNFTYSVKNIQLELGSTAHDFAPYENICPISGRTEASVTRTGFNIWDEQTELGTYNQTTGEKQNNASNSRSVNKTRIEGGTQYYFKVGQGLSQVRVFYYTENSYIDNELVSGLFTPPSNAEYVTFQFSGTSYNHDMCINISDTSKNGTYEPYTAETRTHQYSETIYGGVDDFVNGGATSEQGKLVLNGTENWSSDTGRNGVYYLFNTMASSTYADCVCDRFKTIKSNAEMQSLGIAFGIQNKAIYIPRLFDGAISGVTDVASWKTYLSNNNMEITYPLATNITIQLSPEAVTLLKGLNVISTDGDKVQVEFSDIPVGDYSVLLDYIKSLEARIAAVEP